MLHQWEGWHIFQYILHSKISHPYYSIYATAFFIWRHQFSNFIRFSQLIVFAKKNSPLFTVYHPTQFMWIFCSSQSHNCSSVLFFYKLTCGIELYKGSVCNVLLTMIISIFTGSILLYTYRSFIHGKSFCITLTKMMHTLISNESRQGICACSNG